VLPLFRMIARGVRREWKPEQAAVTLSLVLAGPLALALRVPKLVWDKWREPRGWGECLWKNSNPNRDPEEGRKGGGAWAAAPVLPATGSVFNARVLLAGLIAGAAMGMIEMVYEGVVG
jgi:hypothetical protein